jgi:Thioredoxin-like
MARLPRSLCGLAFVFAVGCSHPSTDGPQSHRESSASTNAATFEERFNAKFASKKSLEDRLQFQLRDARLGYQRVLLIVHDADSPLMKQIDDIVSDYDDRDLSQAFEDYLFLPVNTGDSTQHGEATALATRLKMDLPPPGDVALAVLDETGSLIAESLSRSVASSGTIDRTKLTAFLRENHRALPDAEQLLADAIAKAKQEDKRVFVQVSGPRCGWCVLLSRFLDDHRDLVDKDFVYVKLDSRFEHGQSVIDRFRTNQTGGIPWMVFLDSDGNPLITSDGPEGNIGYPGEAAERVHFEKMLRASARHLTDADIESLLTALSEKTN